MFNEAIFILSVLIDFTFVMLAARAGKEWLFGVIILNMVLITALGAKLVMLFGFVTNVGNGFFASVFLATHLLVELHGKKEGYNAAWIGLASITFFILMSQLTRNLTGFAGSAAVNEAIDVLFRAAPRIALASVSSYVVVQYLNVSIYERIRTVTQGQQLWLRDQVSNMVGQLADSVIFFSVAFLGVIPLRPFLETLLIGFIIKVLVGVVGLPFLYHGARKPVAPLLTS